MDPQPLESCRIQDCVEATSSPADGHTTEKEQASALADFADQTFHKMEPPILPLLSASASLCLVTHSTMREHAVLGCSPPHADCTLAPPVYNTDEIVQKLFAQPLVQPDIELLVMDKLPSVRSASQFQDKDSRPLLAVPTVVPEHSSVTVRQDIAAALLQSLSAVSITGSDHAADPSAGVTFHELIAPGQMLSDTFQTLPLVILEDAGNAADARAETSAVPPASMLKGLHVKKRNLALSELVLDWSLTDASAPDTTLQQSRARTRIVAALTPRLIPGQEQAPTCLPWRVLVEEVAGAPVQYKGLQHRPEKLPTAVQTFLCGKTGHSHSCKGKPSTKIPSCRASQNASPADARVPLGKAGDEAGYTIRDHTQDATQTANFRQQSSNKGSKAMAAGIFSKRPAKRAKRQTTKNDADFFFKLQTGAQKSQESVDDASSSSGDSILGRHAQNFVSLRQSKVCKSPHMLPLENRTR